MHTSHNVSATNLSRKHPLHHSSRIKALRHAASDNDISNNKNNEPIVIFSVDSSGVIIAWRLSMQCYHDDKVNGTKHTSHNDNCQGKELEEEDAQREKTDAPLQICLTYISSANCQGRVTSMATLPL